MVLIKSATRGLCFLLGLFDGRSVSFGHPSRRGWHELDRLQLRLTPRPRMSRLAVVARYGSQVS